MNKSLSLWWKSVSQALGANDRLRWGGWCIVGLSLLYGLLVLRDEHDGHKIKVQQLSFQLQELKSLASESVWQQRLDEASLQNEALTNVLWHGRTEGLVRAALQGSLEQLARKATMEQINVKVSSPAIVEGLVDVMRVRLELRGEFTGGSLFTLLASLEQQQPSLSIQSVQINWGARQNSFSMEVMALIKLEESV